MKKVLLAGLICGISLGFSACSNGDYDANPNTNNSGSGNPLNPGGGGNGGGGNSSFNWSGTDPMSAKIDGVEWKATAGLFTAPLAGFPNYSVSATFGNSTMAFLLKEDIQVGGIYDFASGTTPSYVASYTAENGNATQVYGANIPIGGGKIKILELDATHIKGLFYFTGVASLGGNAKKVITEGYFNVLKF